MRSARRNRSPSAFALVEPKVFEVEEKIGRCKAVALTTLHSGFGLLWSQLEGATGMGAVYGGALV